MSANHSPEPWTYSEATGFVYDERGGIVLDMGDDRDALDHANGHRIASLSAENVKLAQEVERLTRDNADLRKALAAAITEERDGLMELTIRVSAVELAGVYDPAELIDARLVSAREDFLRVWRESKARTALTPKGDREQ